MAPKTPRFFRILLVDAIQQGRLIIPKKFVREYGNYLRDRVFLKVPSGAKWEVELLKTDDGIWFGTGWQVFADYYSLSLGSFLVFGFEDFENCSTFSVLIFDKTTSEIEYPFNVQEDNEEPDLEEQLHAPVNEENSDRDIFPILISSEDELESPSSRPRKKRKQAKKDYRPDRFEMRTQCFTGEEKNNLLNRARTSYVSENPSFSIVMQPSYCDRKENVTIPVSFANEYLKNERGIIDVKSFEGKAWYFEYASYTLHNARRLTMITSGWKKFFEDNHLAIGDVCVFELINCNAFELKVVICRENPDAAKTSSSIGNRKKHLKHKEMSCLEDFTSVNPYFKVKFNKSYLDHSFIHVPKAFIAKCKNRSMEKAMLQVENKVFPVKLLSYTSPNSFKFSAGVSAFVDDNSLQVGDVCVFELINTETMLFKVSIFRNH